MARPKMRDLPDLSDLARPGADIAVRVTPGAARVAVAREGALVRIAVTEPPEKGRANAAVLALLARAMGVPPSRLTLVRGQGTRDKLFRYSGGEGRSR